ncbi:hypothetical protein BDN71DRAFT_1092634 [Pleurotus eryngii]|uniref:Uncharacterized protein n=1 Tax=Pleurotus eryngii TaxID=5323 RepID=A0A9P5ZVP2_PLEER|nr:hypothetical protein BDN71DRAFT_1092634 [Pleurotus eryngii]
MLSAGGASLGPWSVPSADILHTSSALLIFVMTQARLPPLSALKALSCTGMSSYIPQHQIPSQCYLRYHRHGHILPYFSFMF